MDGLILICFSIESNKFMLFVINGYWERRCGLLASWLNDGLRDGLNGGFKVFRTYNCLFFFLNADPAINTSRESASVSDTTSDLNEEISDFIVDIFEVWVFLIVD